MTNGQDPFQVVLIDIQKAANHKIVCVKKPLTEELNYVAISYRRGELKELIIDTHVGYSASITSFDINDFYKLCKAMIKDPTMASIPYMWVDAICINQSNYDARKSTIYHMTDIYERATWILAVPDLHTSHLKAMHKPVMDTITEYQEYLCHLLHGHTSILHEMDRRYLNMISVPDEPNLRLFLKTHRDHFAESFGAATKLNASFKDENVIEHEFNKYKCCRARSPTWGRWALQYDQTPHQCDKQDWLLKYFQQSGWRIARIIIRSMELHRAMHFLTSLVVDWSLRVWVISEFHIAKKKSNLKFWFNQLYGGKVTAFFTFDMDGPRFKSIQNPKLPDEPYASDPLYITFYQQLFNQLNRQTFLEMMLKSKARKNEDRFYAIFPLFPQYKHLLHNKELVTNVNSITDVKLKLYQVMTNKDKLLLLYLSFKGTATLVLPTFATSAIDWQDSDDDKHVDLTVHTTHVTLLYQDTVGFYLRVKPTKYVLTRDARCFEDAALKTLNRLLHPKTVRQDNGQTYVDVLLLFDTMPTPIMLIGSFNENIWILKNANINANTEPIEDHPDAFPGFHVY